MSVFQLKINLALKFHKLTYAIAIVRIIISLYYTYQRYNSSKVVYVFVPVRGYSRLHTLETGQKRKQLCPQRHLSPFLSIRELLAKILVSIGHISQAKLYNNRK